MSDIQNLRILNTTAAKLKGLQQVMCVFNNFTCLQCIFIRKAEFTWFL